MAASPNFFIVGAPKCATSSLSNWLQRHPQVFMSEWKEPRFFDTDLKVRMRVDEEAYRRLFRGADPQQHRAVGEATPWYLYSRVAVPSILRFAPDAKLLLLSLLPRQNDWFNNRINKINAVISTYADGKDVIYYDINGEFKVSDKQVIKDLYVKDELHLAEPGYDRFFSLVQPKIAELLR